MNQDELKQLKAATTPRLLHELVEELIDAAVDLGVGQARGFDTQNLDENLNQAAEKVYNAIEALVGS
jgi:hypothetical protein